MGNPENRSVLINSTSISHRHQNNKLFVKHTCSENVHSKPFSTVTQIKCIIDVWCYKLNALLMFGANGRMSMQKNLIFLQFRSQLADLTEHRGRCVQLSGTESASVATTTKKMVIY